MKKVATRKAGKTRHKSLVPKTKSVRQRSFSPISRSPSPYSSARRWPQRQETKRSGSRSRAKPTRCSSRSKTTRCSSRTKLHSIKPQKTAVKTVVQKIRRSSRRDTASRREASYYLSHGPYRPHFSSSSSPSSSREASQRSGSFSFGRSSRSPPTSRCRRRSSVGQKQPVSKRKGNSTIARPKVLRLVKSYPLSEQKQEENKASAAPKAPSLVRQDCLTCHPWMLHAADKQVCDQCRQHSWYKCMACRGEVVHFKSSRHKGQLSRVWFRKRYWIFERLIRVPIASETTDPSSVTQPPGGMSLPVSIDASLDTQFACANTQFTNQMDYRLSPSRIVDPRHERAFDRTMWRVSHEQQYSYRKVPYCLMCVRQLPQLDGHDQLECLHSALEIQQLNGDAPIWWSCLYRDEAEKRLYMNQTILPLLFNWLPVRELVLEILHILFFSDSICFK
jgi:hypothetical protein